MDTTPPAPTESQKDQTIGPTMLIMAVHLRPTHMVRVQGETIVCRLVSTWELRGVRRCGSPSISTPKAPTTVSQCSWMALMFVQQLCVSLLQINVNGDSLGDW